jgi:hypothetical protein
VYRLLCRPLLLFVIVGAAVHTVAIAAAVVLLVFCVVVVVVDAVSCLISYYLCIYLWLYNPLDLGRFFSFLIVYTVGRTPWTRDRPVARPLPTHRTTQTQNKHTQTSMP